MLPREMGIDARRSPSRWGRCCSARIATPGEPIRLRAHQAAAVRATFKKRHCGSAQHRRHVRDRVGQDREASCWPLPAAPCCRSPILGRPSRRRTSGGRATHGRPRPACAVPRLRPSALRAMIAYPTNALVEDQMSRLRRAVHALAGQGVPLWFGRSDRVRASGGCGPPNPPFQRSEHTAKDVPHAGGGIRRHARPPRCPRETPSRSDWRSSPIRAAMRWSCAGTWSKHRPTSLSPTSRCSTRR